jgi:hypothetical protein
MRDHQHRERSYCVQGSIGRCAPGTVLQKVEEPSEGLQIQQAAEAGPRSMRVNEASSR